MEDRYLYKAKRLDNGEWVVGYYAVIGERNVIIEKCVENYYCPDTCESRHGNKIHEVNSKTICQCTGLKDKNGKLIWENDIVGLYNENKEKRYAVGSVEYGTFNCSCCEGVYGWYFDSADIRDSGRYEVIGNIFDNKELLESEE